MLPVQLSSFSILLPHKSLWVTNGKRLILKSSTCYLSCFNEKDVFKCLDGVWFIFSSSLKIVSDIGKLR